MAERGTHLFDGLPAGVDEAALLAWIEGERLPRDVELAVARYVETNPAAARAMERMRDDRSLLMAMPAARAPADLVDRVRPLVQPVVERQMLLEAETNSRAGRGGGGAVRTKPITITGGSRRSLWQDHRGRLVLAAAAALAITGVGIYFGAQQLSSMGGAGGRGSTTPIAKVPSTDRMAGVVVPVPVLEDATTEHKVVDPLQGVIASAGQAQARETAVNTDSSAARVASIQQTMARESVITPSLAVNLARQGQLVVRIRTDRPGVDAEMVRSRVEAMMREGPHKPFEMIEPNVDALALVSADTVGELMGPPAPTVGPPNREPTVYVVSTPLDERTLAALQQALGDSGDVVFEQAERPLMTPGGTGANVAMTLMPMVRDEGQAAVPMVIETPRRR